VARLQQATQLAAAAAGQAQAPGPRPLLLLGSSAIAFVGLVAWGDVIQVRLHTVVAQAAAGAAPALHRAAVRRMQVKAFGPAANLADALAVFGCFAVVAGAVYWLGSALTLLQEGQKQAVESQKEVRKELQEGQKQTRKAVREELRAGQKQAREELQAGLQALAAQVGGLRESQLAQRLEWLESAAIACSLLGGGGSASRARQAEPP
jgi:hypothetical protein